MSNYYEKMSNCKLRNNKKKNFLHKNQFKNINDFDSEEEELIFSDKSHLNLSFVSKSHLTNSKIVIEEEKSNLSTKIINRSKNKEIHLNIKEYDKFVFTNNKIENKIPNYKNFYKVNRKPPLNKDIKTNFIEKQGVYISNFDQIKIFRQDFINPYIFEFKNFYEWRKNNNFFTNYFLQKFSKNYLENSKLYNISIKKSRQLPYFFFYQEDFFEKNNFCNYLKKISPSSENSFYKIIKKPPLNYKLKSKIKKKYKILDLLKYKKKKNTN